MSLDQLLFAGLLSFAISAHAGTQLLLQGHRIPTANYVAPLLSSEDKRTEEFVVQFKGKVTEALKSELRENGIKVFKYIPEDALIVRSSAQQLRKLQEQTQIQAILPYRGMLKISQNIGQLSVFSSAVINNFTVTLFEARERAEILAQILRKDPTAKYVDVDGRYLTLTMSPSNIPRIAEILGIEFIEAVAPIESFHMKLTETQEGQIAGTGDYTDLDGFENGTAVMNFSVAWDAGFHGEGQTAAMSDTGMDTGNIDTLASDFQGAVTTGFYYGIGASSWEDPMGHGTHVAGSIVSRGTASGGKLRGGAWGAAFVPGGLWSPILGNLSVPPKLSKMFTDAQGLGARVHSNSWGSARNFGAYDSMAIQVDEFMFDNPNFLVLFAAGNSGTDKNKDGVIDSNSMASPATAKNTLTVGASENLNSVGGIQKQIKDLRTAATTWPAEPIWSSKISDNINGMAMFSSRGPTTDGRVKPEIVAPGTNILSNRSHVAGSDPMWGAYNDHYTYAGGTSMATPLTAGAATVVREVLQKNHAQADPSAALIKAMLMHTAFDMYPGQYGEGSTTQELKTRRPNSDEGYGRVDMAQVVNLKNVVVVDEKRGLATGEVYSQMVEVPEGGTLVVNLVYTDAPGTAAAGRALVNNLDLAVLGQNVEMESTDAINNNELFEQSGLAAGNYRIEVRGTNVPMGKQGAQPFALIYSVR